MQHSLDSIIKTDDLPGTTLAAILPDGRLISLAGGWKDVELKKAMPVGGQMFTGSTGKTFVSAVALQLVAEGKFSLDDKVSKYFKNERWFSQLPNAADLTVRSLMNHTSGLPRHIFQPAFLEEIKRNPMRTWTPQECLSVLHGISAIHPVGKGWGYSDSNYLLLGLIIEKTTGDTFYNQAKMRLLEPFLFRHTYPSTQRKLPGLVQGYIGENNFFNLPEKTVENGLYAMNPQFEWCGGGFVTNVEDMAHWLKWLHSGKVLSPKMYLQLIDCVDFKTGIPLKQMDGPADSGLWLGDFRLADRARQVLWSCRHHARLSDACGIFGKT